MFSRRAFLTSVAASAVAFPSVLRLARAANAPGVTESEIKVGQTMPYSGPASAYGMIGRSQLAYLRMINEKGGVNGRKITLVSVDDAYSPPKTVEQTRRLVESEGVAFIHASVGTATNLSVREYLNTAKVPQISIESGAGVFNDPQRFPWSVPGIFQYRTDGRILTKQSLATRPDSKIAVLYQNDDFGRDYLNGVKDILGSERASQLVKTASYESTDPTVDSQIIALQGSGADTLVIAATPKAAAQSIRKTYDIGWSPARYMSYVSATIPADLEPAGIDKSKDIVTTAVLKDPSDSTWADDASVKAYIAFTEKYLPGVGFADYFTTAGYNFGEVLVFLISQCGSDLSRENILKQATNIKEFRSSLMLPGVTLSISPTDYNPLHHARLQKFDGASWRLFGDPVTG